MMASTPVIIPAMKLLSVTLPRAVVNLPGTRSTPIQVPCWITVSAILEPIFPDDPVTKILIINSHWAFSSRIKNTRGGKPNRRDYS
jgi:hypothetical protein